MTSEQFKEAWNNRTVLYISPRGYKKLEKARQISVLRNGKYYTIKLKAVDTRHLNKLIERKKKLDAEIAKLSALAGKE